MTQTPIVSKSAESSVVKQIDIVSNEESGSTVSLLGPGGLSRLEYRESILQDTITVEVFFADTGNAINGKSIIEGLPLIGTEQVKLKFEDNNGNIIKVNMNVNKVSPVVEDTVKSLINLSLVSEEYIRNELGSSRLNVRFDGKISDHVNKILSNYLKTKKPRDIEETANNYNFIGNNRKPYYTMNWLSKKSVPVKDGKRGQSAGFFLFETSDGFKFKSIDGLFAQKQKKSFIFTNTPDKDNGIPAGYDGKVLSHQSDNRIHAQDKFQMGAYGTRLVLFDPFNCYYEVIKQTAEETKKGTKLGGKDLPKLNSKFNNDFTRTTYMLVDKGTLPSGNTSQQIDKSQEQNFDSKNILNQSIRRYNQLFSSMETITIAGDFSLHAGDAIFIDTPGLREQKSGDLNRVFGGLYIISDLCHFISPKNTYTKLNLVRDSFGRKGNHTTAGL